MKNMYDLLNDIPENPEESYPSLSAAQKARMKRNFHRSAGLAKRRSTARWSVAAACLVCLISFSQTALAKTAINGILQTINLGHSVVVQEDPNAAPAKIQYYDKDGAPITSMPEGKSVDLYDKDGKFVGSVTAANGDSFADGTMEEKDLKKAEKNLSFHLLLPATVPDGFEFDHAVLYKDEDGSVSGDYIDLYFTNGSKKIFVQERKISDATATATGGIDVQKLDIHGNTAAMIDGDSLEWEENGVGMYITTQKNLSGKGLVSFAESFQ